MKNFKNIAGRGNNASTRNRGSFSLELIAIVVCVVLVAVLALKTFGGQISNTTNDTTNTVETLTGTVLNSSGSGSGGTGGSGGGSSDPSDRLHRHGSDLANGWCSDEGEDSYYERGVLIIYKNNSKYYMAQDDTLVNGTYGGKTFVDGVEQVSTLDMSNINVADGITTLAAGDFSTKGNLVTINDTQYRVLAVDGTMAKVMSMDGSIKSTFNETFTTTTFDEIRGQKYAESTLDNAMTLYYNSLPITIRNAIVEQNINQSMYRWNAGTSVGADFSAWKKYPFTDADTSGTNYYLTRIADINVGARKVYALDVDDVIAYLGSTSTPQGVNELFFNQRSSVSRRVWLRSAFSTFPDYAFIVYGYDGYLINIGYNGSYEVRPAFILDLSLLTQ